MGTLFRFLLFILVLYLAVRLLKSWWQEDKPRVRGKPREKPDPFAEADIEDVQYTELPPETPEKDED